MLTKKKIIQRVKNMKFFDSRMEVDKDKVDAINKSNTRQIKRFEDEMKICFKMKTVWSYSLLPTTYDILENPKQIITKAEYKRKVVESAPESEVGTVLIQGAGYEGFAFRMSEEEFEVYLAAYKELTNDKIRSSRA